MSYQRRMSIAGIAAAVLHIAVMAAVALYPQPTGPGASIRPDAPPLVVNLQPTPRQLVDVHTPAEVPPENTDRIAEFDSQATDTSPGEGDDGPQVQLEQDFDAVATAAAPTEAPAPEPSEEIPPVEAPRPEANDAPDETPPVQPVADTPPTPEPVPTPEPDRTQVARRAPEAEATPPQPAERPSMERTETARAAPPSVPALPAEREAPLRGRTRGGVEQTGIAGFEAIQDEIAPYLQKIRAAVEREWTTALATRYTGSRPTEAVVECEIAPDGTVVRSEIIGAPSDRIYAAICQTSIVRAGPFGPFPFDIPNMYRNRNLQIRWSFAFISR